MNGFILGLLLASFPLFASESLTASFQRLLRSHRISPTTDQSYCYLEKGKVQGYRVHEMQRIASVTKLLTTLLVVKKAELDQRFSTKIFISPDRIHIAGGADPYWEEDKLLLLLQALNDLGITEVRDLTFDENFIFTDLAFSSHADIRPSHTAERLRFLLSPSGRKTIASLWGGVRAFAHEEGLDLPASSPRFRVSRVWVSASNPLSETGARVFEHQSRPLKDILKAMNVMSKNHVSQNLFRTFTQDQSFEDFMVGLGFSSSEFFINNGSGLPTLSLARADNEATCSFLLRAFALLESEIRARGLELSDVIAVAGSADLGSFRNRFRSYPHLSAGLLAKTGTLRHTSGLAGFLSLGETVPFAILNHTTAADAARKFQEAFVDSFFEELGNPTPVPYEKISIFPWDGEDFLKPLT